VDRIRSLGWPGVVGNTDEVLWRPEVQAEQTERAPPLRPLLELMFATMAPATAERLGGDRVAWLRELPAGWSGSGVTLVHASPGDLWRAPAPDAPDEALEAAYGALGAGTVVYCHIHRPYVRQVGPLTVANAGSVGQPFDGDPRASYLLIDDGVPSIRRVEYDVDREIATLRSSGYPRPEWFAEQRAKGQFVAIA
jgi:diadenosine tetraphosphatase ApaH/serine/threonine PP2A family protein phosphatase